MTLFTAAWLRAVERNRWPPHGKKRQREAEAKAAATAALREELGA